MNHQDHEPLIKRTHDQIPGAAHTRLRYLCYIGLVVCCLEKLVSGSVFAFSVYANDLKATFNYSQTQVEVIVSASNFGEGFAVFPGLFFDRFGPRLTCIVGFIVTVSPLALLWTSTLFYEFYTDKFYLVAFYYTVTGMGSMFCYIASQNTSLANFKSSWRGKLIGLQDSLYGGSLMMFTQVYYNVFQTTSPDRGLFTGFSGFMLLLLISFAAVDFCCLLFSKFCYDGEYDDYLARHALRQQQTPQMYDSMPNINDCDADISQTLTSPVMSSSASINSDEPQSVTTEHEVTIEIQKKREHTPFLQVLKSYDYNIFMWTFVLVGSVASVALNNLTVASKALGYDDKNNLVLSLYAVTIFFGSLLTGLFADVFRRRRIVCQLVATTCSCIATIVYSSACQYFPTFLLASLLICIPSSIMWTTVPAELSDRFGIIDLGRNFGFIRATQTFFNFIFQYLFGYLYEKNIHTEGSIDCYGTDCVRSGYIFLFGVNFAAFFAFLGLGYRVFRRRT